MATVSATTIKIWDPRTGDMLATATHSDGRHNRIRQIHAHGGPILANISDYINSVEIWDPSTGSCIYPLHMRNIITGALSPDGIHMAVLADRDTKYTLDIWNVHTDTCVCTLYTFDRYEGMPVWLRGSCCYSGNGLLLASCSDASNMAIVLNSDDGTCVCTLQGHDDVIYDLVFSPRDATLIATASQDRTVKLWHALTGVCLDTLDGFEDVVYKCVFSPDGMYLATISADNTPRIWDVYTGTCVHIIQASSGIGLCDFSFDGTLLVTARFGDSTVNIWQLPSRLRHNVKLLLLILTGNHRRNHHLWLSTELWDWMNTQWFFY